MKKLLIISLIATFFASSCNRKDDPEPEDNSTEFSSQTTEVSTFNAEMDEVMDEVNTLLGGQSAFQTGRIGAGNCAPAGITNTGSNALGNPIYKVTFDGQNVCNGRTRSGELIVQVISGSNWANAGAVATVSYTNFKVTRTTVNNGVRTFIADGQHTVTNVSGGNVLNLVGGQDIVHRIRGKFQVRFADGANTRNWQKAVVRTYSNNSGVINLNIAGDTTINGKSNVAVFGTNSFSSPFETAYTSPVVLRSNCGWRAPISGKVVHTVRNQNLDITLGTDQNGVGVSNGCASHYLLEWDNRLGQRQRLVLNYL